MRKTPMTAREILKALGGVNKVRLELDAPYTTVHRWWRDDYIPAGKNNKNWRGLLEMAQYKGLPLSIGDLAKASEAAA